MESEETATLAGHERDTPRVGREVVEDEVEARSILARVKAALFQQASERPRLGRYLLDRKLGSGAFGIVYLAYDPDLERQVALKALRPAIGLSDAARERFFREARLLGSVLEPGLAAVFDVGSAPAPPELATREGGDVLYIVMEYVDGPNLAKWLRSEDRKWTAIRDVFGRAGHGLAAAHDKGIVHRDFKPSNVLMGTDGAVKVADFGLAHGLDAFYVAASGQQTESSDELPASLTQTGIVLGTPAYMAPEQHLGEPADPLADQFAFCASLYHGLCRQYAFGRGTAKELTERKLAEQLRPWPSTAKVPRWARAVIERGLRADPSRRYPSMRALLAGLERSPLQRFAAKARWLIAPAAIVAIGYGAMRALEPAEVAINARSDASVDLENLSVTVDGTPVTVTEGVASVSPGHHVIEVSAKDHSPAVRAIEAEAGGTYDFGFSLTHGRGTVDISAAPASARIFVDGVDHGSRVRALALTTGSHNVDVRLDDHYSQHFDLAVETEQHQTRHVALAGVRTWAGSAPGFTRGVQWIPDITGDSRQELVLLRTGAFKVLDPWTDSVVMSQDLAHGSGASITLADGDGDGVPECFAYAPADDATRLTSWMLAPGSTEPRWAIDYPGLEAEDGQLVALDGEVPVVVFNNHGVLEGRRASTGRLVWRWQKPGIERLYPLGPLVLVEHQSGLTALGAGAEVRWSTEGWFAPTILDGGDGEDIPGFWATNAAGEAGRFHGQDGKPASSYRRHGTTRVRSLHQGELDLGYAWTHADGVDIVDSEGAVQRRVAGTRARTLLLTTRGYVASTVGEGVRLTDIETGAIAAEFSQAALGPLRAGDFNGDGKRELMAAGVRGDVQFLSEDLERLATLALSRSVTRMWSLHDGNHDGAQDLVLENNAGIFLVEGPAKKWTVESDHGFRATPSVIRRGEDIAIVTTLEDAGRRRLARVRAHDGQVAMAPATFKADLHRAADTLADGTTTFGYFTSGGGIDRYDLWTGEPAGHRDIGGLMYATPAVVDLDDDGVAEVLVGRFGPTLRPTPLHEEPELTVLSEDLRAVRARVPLSNFTWARALPVDLDGDGGTEVVTFGLTGEVEVFDPARDWAQRWHARIGSRINTAGVAVGDPARPDLAVISMASDRRHDAFVVLDGRTGTELARHRDWGSRSSSPVALDADGDGAAELYALGRGGSLRKFDHDWVHPVWTRHVAVASPKGSPLPSAPLGAGRLSPDGPLVLALAWRDGSLAVVDAAEGEVLWRHGVGAEVESRPLLVDVDGDGTSELIVATHEGKLVCLRIGAPKWSELRGEAQP